MVKILFKYALSTTGIPTEELLEEMTKLKSQDHNPEEGKMFAYVYTGDGDSFAAQRKAYDMFTGKAYDMFTGKVYNLFTHGKTLSTVYSALVAQL